MSIIFSFITLNNTNFIIITYCHTLTFISTTDNTTPSSSLPSTTPSPEFSPDTLQQIPPATHLLLLLLLLTISSTLYLHYLSSFEATPLLSPHMSLGLPFSLHTIPSVSVPTVTSLNTKPRSLLPEPSLSTNIPSFEFCSL